MRIALGIEYDGGQYHGWQSQKGLHTIQSSVEKALSQVANHDVVVHCAGRTDTGVHASAQVVHFDCQNQRSSRAWIYGVNSHLPKDICVKWTKEVDDGFHARHSATARRYKYVIFNHSIRPAIMRANVTWHYRPLNHEKMHQAAQSLVGENDFSSFRAVECQSKTPMRNIHHINVKRFGNLIVIDVKANAFLHHMVRNIAGVLMGVGSGRKPVEWVAEVLSLRDRRMGAETAPSYGLYLVEVDYDEQFGIPKSNTNPIFLMNTMQ